MYKNMYFRMNSEFKYLNWSLLVFMNWNEEEIHLNSSSKASVKNCIYLIMYYMNQHLWVMNTYLSLFAKWICSRAQKEAFGSLTHTLTVWKREEILIFVNIQCLNKHLWTTN